LQIVDVFVPELGKVDNEVSLDTLAAFLDPFLTALATTENVAISERIHDSIFIPLLESNVTQLNSSDEDSSSEEEDLTKVDGGKLSKRSREAIAAIVD
jgi:hypothetical protein